MTTSFNKQDLQFLKNTAEIHYASRVDYGTMPGGMITDVFSSPQVAADFYATKIGEGFTPLAPTSAIDSFQISFPRAGSATYMPLTTVTLIKPPAMQQADLKLLFAQVEKDYRADCTKVDAENAARVEAETEAAILKEFEEMQAKEKAEALQVFRAQRGSRA